MSKPACGPLIRKILFPKNPAACWLDALSTLHFCADAQGQGKPLRRTYSPGPDFCHRQHGHRRAVHRDERSRTIGPDSDLKGPLFSETQHPDALASQPASELILVTSHRRENHGAPMENMFRAPRRIVDSRAGVYVIYPVHLNPNVQKSCQRDSGQPPAGSI